MPQHSRNDYTWAMDEWLKCTTLNAVERNLIEQLKLAAEAGVFEQIRDTYVELFTAVIVSAIGKARDQGILKEWPRAKES